MIVPPAAFTSVPLVTVSCAVKPPPTLVSSIAPRFVNPAATVSTALQQVLLPCTRSVDPAVVVSTPFSALVPSAMNTP